MGVHVKHHSHRIQLCLGLKSLLARGCVCLFTYFQLLYFLLHFFAGSFFLLVCLKCSLTSVNKDCSELHKPGCILCWYFDL